MQLLRGVEQHFPLTPAAEIAAKWIPPIHLTQQFVPGKQNFFFSYHAEKHWAFCAKILTTPLSPAILNTWAAPAAHMIAVRTQVGVSGVYFSFHFWFVSLKDKRRTWSRKTCGVLLQKIPLWVALSLFQPSGSGLILQLRFPECCRSQVLAGPSVT